MHRPGEPHARKVLQVFGEILLDGFWKEFSENLACKKFWATRDDRHHDDGRSIRVLNLVGTVRPYVLSMC